MFVPSLLASLLIVISFHWDVGKLTLLRVSLHEVMKYRLYTNVDIVVVTDNLQALNNALHAFNYHGVDTVLYNKSKNNEDKYDLLWEHRNVVEERFHNDQKQYSNYSTFLYFEDDTFIPWSHLVSWAIDNDILEKLGFSRGVYRTEINKAGRLSMNDMVVDLANFLGCQMNITNDPLNPHSVKTIDAMEYNKDGGKLFETVTRQYRRKLCVDAETSATWSRRRLQFKTVVSSDSPRKASKHQKHNVQQQHLPPGFSGKDKSSDRLVPCPIHNHFVQLYSPFQGMWIFSRNQLAKIMKDPLWNRSDAMQKDTRRQGQQNWNWGAPERSNSILFFVDPPNGFFTTNLVPFIFINSDKKKPRLSKFAAIEHLRNGYDIVCTVDDALTV
jgi:hypothetical protein